MIWIFLAVLLGVITFTSLGAMSVWVSMLTMAVKVMVTALLACLLYFAFRRYRRKA